MHVITAVLTLALLQGDPDARALRDKIERLEKRLPELDFKIRLAVREERFEDAQRHTQDYQDLELEIAQAKEKVEQMKAKAPPRLQWYKNIHGEGQGRHTGWDNELGLGDGIGWGIEVSFRDFLTLEYRRWETDDDLMRGDAEIQAYMVGVTQEFSLSQ